MFQIIGKAWTEGITPYVGVFDHKGPFIFFVNALGYLMGKIWFGCSTMVVYDSHILCIASYNAVIYQ